MKASELISMLEEAVEYHGDIEVLIVHQENYPLQETVRGLYDPREDAQDDRDALAEIYEANPGISEEDARATLAQDREESHEDHLYIVAGGHPYDASPYGPRAAFEGGW